MKPETLDELEALAEEAIEVIERHPEQFSLSFDEVFEYMPEGPGRYGEDWDTESVASQDDDGWRAYDYNHVYVVNKDGSREIECCSFDGDNWETDCSFSEDCPEFRFEMATTGCHYHILKNDLYWIHVARTGEDPLGWVIPLKENHKGICTATAVKGGGITLSRKWEQEILSEVREVVIDFLGGDFATLHDDLCSVGAKVGEHNKEQGEVSEWMLTHWSLDKIVIRLRYCVSAAAPDQSAHIQEVATRRLEPNVRSAHKYVMDQVKEVSRG